MHVLVGDEPALVQGDHAVGGARGFLGVGSGEQDRAALGCVGPQHAVEPVALAAGKAVGGLVEQERVGVRKQRAGQTEAAVHAARQGAEAFVAQTDEAHCFEDFVSAPRWYARRGAQHAQMSPYGTGGMTWHIAQQHTDFKRRVGDAVQRAASEVGDATALLQFEHQPERGRLARARGSEECGDTACARLEGEVVDSGRKVPAGVAGQSEGLDHPNQDSALCPFFRAPQGPLRSENSAFGSVSSFATNGAVHRSGGNPSASRPACASVTPRGAASEG